MEAKANGVEGAREKKTPTQNVLIERHLSVLTLISANRCDQFNEACALDLALLSSGKIFQKKHHIIWATLFTTQCLASPPSWNWHVMLCVGTTPPWQVAQLSLPEWHNEHQILVPKVGANQAVLLSAEWKKSDIAGLHDRTVLGKSSNAETKETWRQRERTHTNTTVTIQSARAPKQRSYTMWITQLPYFFLSYGSVILSQTEALSRMKTWRNNFYSQE